MRKVSIERKLTAIRSALSEERINGYTAHQHRPGDPRVADTGPAKKGLPSSVLNPETERHFLRIHVEEARTSTHLLLIACAG